MLSIDKNNLEHIAKTFIAWAILKNTHNWDVPTKIVKYINEQFGLNLESKPSPPRALVANEVKNKKDNNKNKLQDYINATKEAGSGNWRKKAILDTSYRIELKGIKMRSWVNKNPTDELKKLGKLLYPKSKTTSGSKPVQLKL